MTIEGAPKPSTIYDVAELAGASASTVSRAFNRPGRVASETSTRIRACAVELGYRTQPVHPDEPNSTRLVGLLVSDPSSRFDTELARSVASCFPISDVTVVTVVVGAEPRRRRSITACGPGGSGPLPRPRGRASPPPGRSTQRARQR